MVKPDFAAWLRARTKQDGDCVIWQQGLNSRGYPQACWQGKGGLLVSRLVLEHRMGQKLTSKECAVPICGNRLCVSELCLIAKSRSKVMRESYVNGARCPISERDSRLKRAIASGMAKLDMAKAQEIRALAVTHTRAHLAQQYGVSERAIGHILTGRSWRSSAANSSVFNWRPAA